LLFLRWKFIIERGYGEEGELETGKPRRGGLTILHLIQKNCAGTLDLFGAIPVPQ
jgi:hypothetical protein